MGETALINDPQTRLPSELKAHRFTELDSLRGLAATTVVFHHFALIWVASAWFAVADRSPLHVLIAGREAVVLFFVLSGFVLSVPYSGARRPSYRGFLLKRFCRIYLPYAAALLLAALCSHRFYSVVNTGDTWIDHTWSHAATAKQVIKALLTAPTDTRALNVAFWTLVLEIRVSIVFPFLFWLSSRVHAAVLIGGCAVLCGLWPILLPHHSGSILGLTYVCGLFLVGITLYRNLAPISARFSRLSRTGRTSFLVGAILLFEVPNIVLRNFDNRYPANVECLRDYVISIGAVGLLVYVIDSARSRRILNHPLLLRLGALSYSVYLMHGTVLFVLIRLFMGKVPFGYLLPVYLILVYLASEAFHAVIDQPAVFLGRRVGKSARVAKAG